ncbi:MAG: peptidoglycan glycosyltransferase, partial [Saprospiraceae bacterium]|nr:peptidoglycan glycosyltransferase [Saprospiraceae bacterium]
MDIRREFLGRVYILMGVFGIAAMVLFGKAVKISVVEGDKWKALGDSLYLRYLPIEADRGNILAYDGSFLATSLPFFDIRMDLRADGMTDEVFRKNIDSLAYHLSVFVDGSRSPAEYKRWLSDERRKGNRYLLIKRKATFSQMKLMKSFPLWRKGSNVGGFIAERKSVRQKPLGELAARTIGIDRVNAQKIGLEGSFHKDLAGEEGRKLMKRVSRGIWIPVSDLSEVEPDKGADVHTTIDVNIQDIAHQALERGLKKYHAD